MDIQNSSLNDIDTIFDLYDEAIEFQKTVFEKHWLGFERSMVKQEIQENRQYKIIIDGEIAGIFVLAFNDDLFWKEKALTPSLYIHRIVTKAIFRGRGMMQCIIKWAKNYCQQHQLQYIRIDTWGDNPRLIDYYMKCGFKHVDTIPIEHTDGLPIHYNGLLALLEMEVI